MLKRFTTAAVSLVAATVGAVAVGAAPSYALASCPDNHICFYKDFHYLGNGKYSPAGTMSDQTAALTTHPTSVKALYDNVFHSGVFAWGKISDFRNSHYTDGESLEDSVSFVVNNTGWCLDVYTAPDFHTKDSTKHYQGVSFGPDTSRAMAGANLGPNNDDWSSAFVTPRGSTFCLPASGNYLALDVVQN